MALQIRELDHAAIANHNAPRIDIDSPEAWSDFRHVAKGPRPVPDGLEGALLLELTDGRFKRNHQILVCGCHGMKRRWLNGKWSNWDSRTLGLDEAAILGHVDLHLDLAKLDELPALMAVAPDWMDGETRLIVCRIADHFEAVAVRPPAPLTTFGWRVQLDEE